MSWLVVNGVLILHSDHAGQKIAQFNLTFDAWATQYIPGSENVELDTKKPLHIVFALTIAECHSS